MFASVIMNEKKAAEVCEVNEEPTSELTEEERQKEAIAMMQEETTEEESVEEETTEEEPVEGQIPFSLNDGTVTKYIKWNDNAPRSAYYTNPGIKPITTKYDFVKVEDPSYYANSLFIGDSRIAGLHDYSGWDQAAFCYKTGLNVYTMMTEQLNIGLGLQASCTDVLASRQFENIYIMIGINELGSGLPEDFAAKYKENVDIIRSYQPNARIILMGIMYVTAEYAEQNDVFNNDNINCRNIEIAKLANGVDTFYLDMNPAVVDETGALNPEISFDGVHLIAKYYYLWTDFMNEHGY